MAARASHPPPLIEAVRDQREWGDATIKTLLGRLMQKKAIRSEREDGRLLYHPMITRDAYVAGEVHSLIDRLFHGDTEALAATLNQLGPAPGGEIGRT